MNQDKNMLDDWNERLNFAEVFNDQQEQRFVKPSNLTKIVKVLQLEPTLSINDCTALLDFHSNQTVHFDLFAGELLRLID